MKKGKTKKIVALASVLALSCACGASTLVPNAYEAPVAVYAEETEKDLVAEFVTMVEALDETITSPADVDTKDALLARDVRYANLQYVQIGTELGKEAQESIDAAVMAVYDVYYNAFAEMFNTAAEADKSVMAIEEAIAGDKIIYASERAVYEAAYAYMTPGVFEAEEIAIINGLDQGDRVADLAIVTGYFDDKDAAEAAATNAVAGIATPIKIASIEDINDAYDVVEAAYGTFDVDAIKAPDIVSAKATLDGYFADYEALVKDVEELKGIIAGLEGALANGKLSSADFQNAWNMYESFTDEQKDSINNEICKDGKTYYEVLKETDKMFAKVFAAANIVIDLITAIPQPITIDSGVAINTAKDEYDAFVAKYNENYISNKDVLFDAIEKLSDITKDVEEWKLEVDKLPPVADIVITDEAAVIALEAFFTAKGFSVAMQNYIETVETTYWEKHTGVRTAINTIKDKIKVVAENFINLPEIVADYGTDTATYIAEVLAFTTAYETAMGAFDALSADEQAYFNTPVEDDAYKPVYVEGKAAKEAATQAYEIYGVEGKILSIREVNTLNCATDLNLDDAALVDAAEKAYNDLSAEKKVVFKAEFKAKLDAATTQIANIRDVLKDFAEELNAALAGDFTSLEVVEGALMVEDVVLLEALYNEYNGFAALYAPVGGEDLYPDELKVAKAAYDAARVEIIDNIKTINADIQTIKAAATLTAELRALLDDITERYEALCVSQVSYIVDYTEVVENTLGRIKKAEAVEAAINAINADVLTVDGYAQVKAIRAMYENLEAEIKGLVSNVDVLEAAEAAYAADDAIILDIAAIKAELAEKVDALEAAKLALEQADAANKAEITALQTALEEAKTALNTANANISALQGKVDALQTALDEAKATLNTANTNISALQEKITALETALNTANANISALQGEIDGLDDAYKAADLVLDGKITALKTELEGKIAELKATLEAADAADKAELEGIISALETALKAADASTIEDLEALETKLDAAKAELEQKIADFEDALKAADDANKAELQAEIDALRKSLTTATVILAIVSGLAFAGVVALFVLKFFVKKKD